MIRSILASGLFYLVILTSCQKETAFTTEKSAKLNFSADTILFDTVFTSIGSTTRRLKVFNRNKKALRISEIKLEGTSGSAYQININGQPSNQAKDIEIAGQDSLTIFIRVNINPTAANLPFIVSDYISFITNGNKQLVQLAAYGQNAHFLDEITINKDTVWDNAMPYVIYKSAFVNENKQLTIKKGARIYFHKDARLLVAGTLIVEGEQTDSVTFSSDRLEHIYRDEPGQWGGLHFLKASKNNLISYSTIKNASIGIQVDSLSLNSNPKVLLSHSIIKNMEITGLYFYNSDVKMFNNLIYNCGKYLVYGTLGGNYDLQQNTFAAYNYNFPRQTPAIFFGDNILVNNILRTSNLQVKLINNIIYGSLDDELVFDKKGSSDLSLNMQTNLIKTKNTAFTGNGNLINKDPIFIDSKNDNFQLTNKSPAINIGSDIGSNSYFTRYLSTDLKGKSRVFPSELGCYEVE